MGSRDRISVVRRDEVHSVRGLWYRPVYRTQPDHELARHVRDAGAKLFHRRYRVIDRSRSDPWCISSTLLLCARRTNVSSDLSDHADLFITTPGVAEQTAGGFPAISAAPGQFLLKDAVLS